MRSKERNNLIDTEGVAPGDNNIIDMDKDK